VLKGKAGAALLESYDLERMQAADENIGHSTRSTDFIAPRSSAERELRNAVLSLAPKAEFARRMVNSGRLSVATTYASPLTTPDADSFSGTARLGAPAPDAPLRGDDGDGFLIERLPGAFTVLTVKNGTRPPPPAGAQLIVIGEDLHDEAGIFAKRFDATPGATYVLRPDQHLTARFRHYDAAKVQGAIDRALGC
jgi:3-(3-hydroxy-phenyl)propionate hydroxylase